MYENLYCFIQVLAADLEMMSLDLGTLCQRYPDITHEQVRTILEIFMGQKGGYYTQPYIN